MSRSWSLRSRVFLSLRYKYDCFCLESFEIKRQLYTFQTKCKMLNERQDNFLEISHLGYSSKPNHYYFIECQISSNIRILWDRHYGFSDFAVEFVSFSDSGSVFCFIFFFHFICPSLHGPWFYPQGICLLSFMDIFSRAFEKMFSLRVLKYSQLSSCSLQVALSTND